MNAMSTTEILKTARWCWRKDLAGYRGLTDCEKTGFLLVLEWFENFRLRHELPAGREAAKSFWRCEVLGRDRKREPWQLDQWEDAMKWYLNWFAACSEGGADHRSLPERVRAAVRAAGSRRGLAPRTKDCYGLWVARYAVFARDQREIMREETATRFLTSVVDDEDCAYSTQKQALNAIAFFFKHVCGTEDPVFRVKLRQTGARVPVVLSQGETQRLFEVMADPKDEPELTKMEPSAEGTNGSKPKKHNPRYGLVARLQYGAGLRLSEVVGLRVKDLDLDRGTVTVRLGKGGQGLPRVPPPGTLALRAACGRLSRRLAAATRLNDRSTETFVRRTCCTDRAGPCHLGEGPTGRSRRRLFAGCAGEEVPPGGGKLRVVLDFSRATAFSGSRESGAAASSPPRKGLQRGNQAGGDNGRH